jgi:hypothetical protein
MRPLATLGSLFFLSFFCALRALAVYQGFSRPIIISRNRGEKQVPGGRGISHGLRCRSGIENGSILV